MKILKSAIIATSILITTGCASGMNSIQEQEYSAFEHAGVLVKAKNPSTGVALGFLPGGGSFYAREPGLGVVNLLLWPLSIFWDPISGSDGSKSINYALTKYQLQKDKSKEMIELDGELSLDTISQEEYILMKKKIDEKYNYS